MWLSSPADSTGWSRDHTQRTSAGGSPLPFPVILTISRDTQGGKGIISMTQSLPTLGNRRAASQTCTGLFSASTWQVFGKAQLDIRSLQYLLSIT